MYTHRVPDFKSFEFVEESMSALFKVIFFRFYHGKSPFKPPFGEYFFFQPPQADLSFECLDSNDHASGGYIRMK